MALVRVLQLVEMVEKVEMMQLLMVKTPMEINSLLKKRH